MGFWDFLKKKNTMPQQPPAAKAETNSFGERLDRLTPDGELPWGWFAREDAFVAKIGGDHSYFLQMWVDARDKSPKELYPALKSFVLFLNDAEKLCKSKGECYEFWFYEYLASKDYIAKRKTELNELTTNFDDLQKKYDAKEERTRKVIEMKDDVILLLKENDGILQSDFRKFFDDEICRAAALDIVNALLKEGKIEKTKSGRSYLLHYKE